MTRTSHALRTAATGTRRPNMGSPPTQSAGGTPEATPAERPRPPRGDRPTPDVDGTEATHLGARTTQPVCIFATRLPRPTCEPHGAPPRGDPHPSAART